MSKALCWIVGFFFVALEAPLPGEEPQAAAATAPSLERIAERLQKGADIVQKKAKELLAVIDSEASAKRISEPIAQGLRWSLRGLSSAADPNSNDKTDIVTMVAAANLPASDEAIVKAGRDLQDAAVAARTEGPELLRQANVEAEGRCSELVGHATSAAQADALITVLERLRGLRSGQSDYYLERCITVTRHLRDCFDLTPSSDPEAVKSILFGLEPLRVQGAGFGREADYAARVASLLAPFKKAFENARMKLDAALAARQPAKEAYSALAAFERAQTRYQECGGNAGSAFWDSNAERNNDRTLCGILETMEQHRWEKARVEIIELRHGRSLLQIPVERKDAIIGLLEKWEREISVAEVADRSQFHDHLQAELAGVKRLSDLEPILKEVRLRERNLELSKYSRDPQGKGVAEQLSALAAAWGKDDLSGLTREAFADYRSAQGAEEAAVRDLLVGLRDRAGREILSRTLKAPELLREPLANQPLEQAVDGLLERLRSSGEWRRALPLMEAQAALDEAPRGEEAILAVRSWLAGQNFELAEVWLDAAAAYKAVLAAAADGTPVKEASARLKALAKEHPDAVKAAQARPAEPLSPSPQGGGQ